jgi:hypothetical protein
MVFLPTLTIVNLCLLLHEHPIYEFFLKSWCSRTCNAEIAGSKRTLSQQLRHVGMISPRKMVTEWLGSQFRA